MTIFAMLLGMAASLVVGFVLGAVCHSNAIRSGRLIKQADIVKLLRERAQPIPPQRESTIQ